MMLNNFSPSFIVHFLSKHFCGVLNGRKLLALTLSPLSKKKVPFLVKSLQNEIIITPFLFRIKAPNFGQILLVMQFE